MDTGSREENASEQEARASVLIQSEPKCSSDPRGDPFAGSCQGQQHRPGASSSKEEVAARGRLQRDEAPQIVRKAIGKKGSREIRGCAASPQACPQASDTGWIDRGSSAEAQVPGVQTFGARAITTIATASRRHTGDLARTDPAGRIVQDDAANLSRQRMPPGTHLR